jgi:hypothetical protein
MYKRMATPSGIDFHAKMAWSVIGISMSGSGLVINWNLLHMASTLRVGAIVLVGAAVRVGIGVNGVVGVHVGGRVCNPSVGAGVVGRAVAAGVAFAQAVSNRVNANSTVTTKHRLNCVCNLAVRPNMLVKG